MSKYEILISKIAFISITNNFAQMTTALVTFLINVTVAPLYVFAFFSMNNLSKEKQ